MNESVAAVHPTARKPPAACRDLEADLAICEGATPGPWVVPNGTEFIKAIEYDEVVAGAAWLPPRVPGSPQANAKFFEQAREGWPYAIRRAMEAEKEIDRLQNELQIYQEQEHRGRGPWD